MANYNDNTLLPLHRRYRPSKLIDYIGNIKMVNSIIDMLKGGYRPQILLFYGESGCGKTSMARLVAMEYLCEDRSEITGACGKCGNCEDMTDYIESGSLDSLMFVREVDNTDSNKKQDIEALIEEAMMPVIGGGWRVYIFDEAHKMSSASQSRLLKFTEEPPEKVLIIFCTTDPETMLKTLLNRCQNKYRVQKPTQKELVNLLAKVSSIENMKYDIQALNLLSVKSDFVPRNALMLLERVIKEKNSVTKENTLDVLGDISENYYFDFLRYFIKGEIDVYAYITMIVEIKSKMDLNVFVASLISFIRRGIYIYHGIQLEGVDKDEISEFGTLFKRFTPVQVVAMLKFLMDNKHDDDIEAKLLLLGYSGLETNMKLPEKSIPNLQEPAELVRKEQEISTSNYVKRFEADESDIEALTKRGQETLDTTDILTMFEGRIIENEG